MKDLGLRLNGDFVTETLQISGTRTFDVHSETTFELMLVPPVNNCEPKTVVETRVVKVLELVSADSTDADGEPPTERSVPAQTERQEAGAVPTATAALVAAANLSSPTSTAVFPTPTSSATPVVTVTSTMSPVPTATASPTADVAQVAMHVVPTPAQPPNEASTGQNAEIVTSKSALPAGRSSLGIPLLVAFGLLGLSIILAQVRANK